MQNLLIGGSNNGQECLNLKYANRHGLISGATGTGKTVTLQVLAEGFSAAGVPVFLADVKGDLAGISQPGKPHPKVDERVAKIGIQDFSFSDNPVQFWDVFGKLGQPVRATVSEMGPILLAQLLELNETQEGVLTIAFQYADDNGLLLLDFEDLEALMKYVAENAKEMRAEYGNVSVSSVGAIQRSLLQLKRQGAEQLFGEPALQILDLLHVDHNGKGVINILAAEKLIHTPKVYAMFLLWLLSELFEHLPEVGDAEKPELVFFFDEAHLLFDHAPNALLGKIEQVVRLIRSKGVGVYFVTQNPMDVPNDVLGQLGNRIQHALRAFTPRDQKAVKVAAETFRQNPELDTEEIISNLGVGEALVSTLQDKGVPGIVQRTLICPPVSRIGGITAEERQSISTQSILAAKYDHEIDRHSASEMLEHRMEQQAKDLAENEREDSAERRYKNDRQAREYSMRGQRQGVRRTNTMEKMANQFMRTIGQQLVRSLMGNLKKR